MGKNNIMGFSFLAFCVYVAVLGLFPFGVHSCSPPIGPVPPNAAESRIHYADVVVYGTVVQHYSDALITVDSFEAEMEIICIFKGAPVKQFINVTNVGFMPGMCFGTTLSIGRSYVVFLSRNGDSYLPNESDIEVTGINDPYFNNVTQVCGLSTQYPIGVNESSSRLRCPETNQGPNCVRHVDQPPEGQTEVMPPDYTTDTNLKNYPGPEVKVDSSANLGKEPSAAARLNVNSILGVTSLIAILTFIR